MLNNLSAIEKYIIENIKTSPSHIAKLTAEHFKITAQSVHKHLKKLESLDLIFSEGIKRGKKYYLKETKFNYDLKLLENTQENDLWNDYIKPHLSDLPKNIYDICHHGSTEMLNNVIDHSNTKNFHIEVVLTALSVSIVVIDYGVGIFEKIKNALNLKDHLEALQELVKGKLTTDPGNHSGEGIFFTSRMFDKFSILSGELSYIHDRGNFDILFTDGDKNNVGTMISMTISKNSNLNTQDVFKLYESDDFIFNKTFIPIKLSKYGDDNLISRSQAKRILSRLEKFKEIILDFADVEMIGQAFADEIFRVFINQHPEIRFIPINANDEVSRMIKRVEANKNL